LCYNKLDRLLCQKDLFVFSQLAPLFKTTLRQAEQADTRLHIRQEDKEDQGKKQEFEDKADDTSALWEDRTEVSVGALRTFLVEFLKSRGDVVPETPAEKVENVSIISGLTPESRPPASNRAARAVKAYTSMQTQNYGSTPLPEKTEEASAQEVDLVSLLAADELRTIHVLIAELDMLARRGVQTLMIEKADTFLQALVEAVRLAKTNI
jgi:hypothetical protein